MKIKFIFIKFLKNMFQQLLYLLTLIYFVDYLQFDLNE